LARIIKIRTLLFLAALTLLFSCKDEPDPTGTIQLASVKIGDITLDLAGDNPGMPVDQNILVQFNNPVDSASALENIALFNGVAFTVVEMTFSGDKKNITLKPAETLQYSQAYLLQIGPGLEGASKETFPGLSVNFETAAGKLKTETVLLNGLNFKQVAPPRDVSRSPMTLEITFSHELDPTNYSPYFTFFPPFPFDIGLSPDQKKVTITAQNPLEGYTRFYFSVNPGLESIQGFDFDGFYNSFYTELDTTLKFPLVSDDELLDIIQRQTFRYFYDFAHPASGMAHERNTSGDIVTTGGSGFGLMALVVGMERQYITRSQGLDHLEKILSFLESCDRFHGAWPHWLNGTTGKTHPFSTEDDGADLVETGFMVQGLYTIRQYLSPLIPEEAALIGRISDLVNAVEWDWFTRDGQDVLYWHWSPNYGWAMNMRIEGYNETLICYVLAAASPTHSIPASAYHSGYARNGAIANGNSYYGIPLPLGWAYGGPLFFTHYSHLGLDPRGLSDAYADYWEQGRNMSLINRAYCIDNPKNFVGYSEDCWGLTASDNPTGYSAHSPTNDLGVITPTAAVSALPYTPEESMAAIRHFYYMLGDKLWGEYGFYDAFDVTDGWWADSYIAIDQGPIVCMIENHRSGLLWDLFMSAPEVQAGLDQLGFIHR
jgi:hypothetical protein